MPSPVEERDARIVARYLENKDLSAERIAMDEGLSTIRIKQILKAGGAIGKPRGTVTEGDASLSPSHVRIGQAVTKHRMLVLGVDRSFFANKLKWSAVKLSYVEQGKHNLTLFDLENLARALSLTTIQLLEFAETPAPVVGLSKENQNP